ncbi:branched-chain amino acid transport system II carrier protein [Vaginisenegalia massiliensis]|uniref:branched-chain amino acid transport system II carrier protein n=1 Tax=Vaginisenegalia massiliensis TaxID=2058294 RepID=UPI000F53C875|nr:branched-chain amino acid transport system II carrier protein [Vaginisenegalia massiliensis]
MEKNRSLRHYFFIGSLVFGLFFGAGNLIFPVHLGQVAGHNLWQANLGFILTGVGLPFLGLLAIALSQVQGVFDLAQRVSRPFAYFFTVVLYLVIGPFFAMPRLATTSFQIGLAPFLAPQHQTLALMIFSLLFFSLSFLLALRPAKLLDYIGKYLNPTFLILLTVLLVATFVHPLGSVSGAAVQVAYQQQAFLQGFRDGYSTLDALAAIAFGAIIIENLRSLGFQKAQDVTKAMIKGGSIAVVAMIVIYSCLALAGTLSLGQFPLSENGGIALAQIAQEHLGLFGSVLLALIVIVACFKTSIGLATAVAEAFHEMFPQLPYRFYLTTACVLPAIFANVGLTKLIELSIPVLMFIYPLAMVLILLTLIDPGHRLTPRVYQITLVFTLVAACMDAINAFPSSWSLRAQLAGLLASANHWLPFFNHGFGWLIPALVGFAFALLLGRLTQSRRIQN